VQRRAAGVGRVAQRPLTLDPLDVDDVGTGRHPDLHGLPDRVAQLDQEREGLVADHRAFRGHTAVLDEAEPQPVPPVGGAIEEAAAREHRAGAVGRALGHADPPGQLAQAQLRRPGQGVDDVQGDADRLQCGLLAPGRARPVLVAVVREAVVAEGAHPAQ
jgi:hypothetical protein